jgi:mannose PTS system EIIA component
MRVVAILIVAHDPLATAMLQAAQHVFPDCANMVKAMDVPAHDSPDLILQKMQQHLSQWPADQPVLILADVFGATPCNVAQKLCERSNIRLLAGLNIPMLLRSITYAHEGLDAVTLKAQSGGAQGIMSFGSTAPQNQVTRPHAREHHHHQQ